MCRRQWVAAVEVRRSDSRPSDHQSQGRKEVARAAWRARPDPDKLDTAFQRPKRHDCTRFVPVLFHESFEGRENENLTDELLTELPGILNWAIEGWRRLRAKGKFILPPTSLEALERMKKKAAPMLNFVEEECEIGSELSWERNPCYEHYVACCEASNNKPLSRPKFVEAMEDLNLGIKCRCLQAAPGETKRPYVFVGIGKLGKARREATILKMPQPTESETSRASGGSGAN